MAKALNLTSRVRAGMVAERQSATERLKENDVAGTAVREAAHVIGFRGETPASGSRFKVRISELISNPFNPRVFYNAETIDGLAKSFEQDGQLEPIKITKLPDFPDKWVVVDGERRKRAGESRGDEYIDAEICHEALETKTLYLRAYRANKEREEQTVFDDAVSWKKLLDQGVYRDYAELAVAVGEPSSHVNKVILLTSLPPSFLNRLAQFPNDIGLSHAYNLKLIFERAGHAVAEHWLQEILDGKASVRRLEQAASADAPHRRTGSKRTHYQSRVQFKLANGAKLGELKLFGDGRTELSLEGVPAEAQQALAEKMKALIEEWSMQINDGSSDEQSVAS